MTNKKETAMKLHICFMAVIIVSVLGCFLVLAASDTLYSISSKVVILSQNIIGLLHVLLDLLFIIALVCELAVDLVYYFGICVLLLAVLGISVVEYLGELIIALGIEGINASCGIAWVVNNGDKLLAVC